MTKQQNPGKSRTAFSEERTVWLHERIRAGSFPNAYRLKEKFSISLSQAHRDVKHLKELGAPMKFDSARGGFYYTSDFALPDSFFEDDTENSLFAMQNAEDALGGSVQMRIPYNCEIEVATKVGALELGRYVVSRGKGKGRYVCEFRNPELFIGMLVASGQKVRVISPEWLRDKLCELCENIMDCNKE